MIKLDLPTEASFNDLGSSISSLSSFAFLCTVSAVTASNESSLLQIPLLVLAIIFFCFAIFYWVRTIVASVNILVMFERDFGLKFVGPEVLVAGFVTIAIAVGVVYVTLQSVLP